MMLDAQPRFDSTDVLPAGSRQERKRARLMKRVKK